MKEYFPKSDLFEKLAAIEHERWADWQKWIMENIFIEQGQTDVDGRKCKLVAIPYDDFNRWYDQYVSHYTDLSEEDKDKDREQVMRYWYLIK